MFWRGSISLSFTRKELFSETLLRSHSFQNLPANLSTQVISTQQIYWLLTSPTHTCGTLSNHIPLHELSLVFRVLPRNIWCIHPSEGDEWISVLWLSNEHAMVFHVWIQCSNALGFNCKLILMFLSYRKVNRFTIPINLQAGILK